MINSYYFCKQKERKKKKHKEGNYACVLDKFNKS